MTRENWYPPRPLPPSPAPEIRYLGDLQRIELAPDDVLVLSVDQVLDDAVLVDLRKRLQCVVGEQRKCIVLTRGMKLGVLHAAEA